MITALLLVHFGILMAFTFRILLRHDLTPQARLAWFVVLMVLPLFGSIIYLLFGEIDLGDKANKNHTRIYALIRQKAAGLMGVPSDVPALIAPLYQSIFNYTGSINGFYPVGGNTATLLPDAEATLHSIVADIDAATDHVHVLYYIWLTDNTGTQIAHALMRAAQRGITCRAMADGLGSRTLLKSGLWGEMRNAGVLLAVALPLNNLLGTIFSAALTCETTGKSPLLTAQSPIAAAKMQRTPNSGSSPNTPRGSTLCCALKALS